MICCNFVVREIRQVIQEKSHFRVTTEASHSNQHCSNNDGIGISVVLLGYLTSFAAISGFLFLLYRYVTILSFVVRGLYWSLWRSEVVLKNEKVYIGVVAKIWNVLKVNIMRARGTQNWKQI